MSAPAPTPGPKRFPGALIVFALVAMLAAGFLAVRGHINSEPTAPDPANAAIGGPFSLVDQDGRAVTDADFRGKYMLVYFGFTFCPDVCPTALTRNLNALDLLGAKAQKITPILISVDPERDTPEKMKQYVTLFGPQLVGLTGTPEQAAAAARAYRVFAVKVDASTAGSSAYLVDHSSLTYLMGPDGRFIQIFGHSASPEEVAAQLAKVVR